MAMRRATARRMGVEGSEIRLQLIDEAAKLMKKEGWEAVTARRLAEKLGLKRQIVHYYFSTIEDLLIAVIRQGTEAIRERLIQDLQGEEPLRVIWELGARIPGTIFEFTSMALRRKAIQAEIRRHLIEFRKIEIAAIDRYLELRGIRPTVSPAAMAVLLSSLGHTLSVERVLGTVEGHAQVKDLVENWLRAYAESGGLSAEPSVLICAGSQDRA